MDVTTLPFSEIPQFSSRDKAYVEQDPRLRPFYRHPPTLTAFADALAAKQRADIDRPLLLRVLRDQYAQLDREEAVMANIERLADEKTFTVVTAHQPCLFTGPLYFIYKIASAIRLTEVLQATYPDYHFVPVFVTGGEDHDFAEINHAHLFGQTIEWENDEAGPVGRMKTTTLDEPLARLREILGDSDNGRQAFDLVATAYGNHRQYGMATIDLVHQLFKRWGLVALSMDQPELKKRFLPIMEEELFSSPSQPLIEATTRQLEEAGFSGQAYAREINLFYLSDQSRERIVRENDRYQVLNTDFSFSAEELRQELQTHPERFSPNVILRPLYQEAILPNLAYVGGGGELAYWLERKSQFAHFGIDFPILIRRNSVLWIDSSAAKRMEKLGLSERDILRKTDDLIREHVHAHASEELNLQAEKEALNELFDRVAGKAGKVDQTLVGAVEAERVKQIKSLEQLEGRLVRAEKQKHENAINQIRSIRDKLFPENGLQERYDNFLAYYLRYGPEFLTVLVQHLNPLEQGLIVVWDR